MILRITLATLTVFELCAAAYAGEASHITVVPPPLGYDPAAASPAANAQLRLPPEPDPSIAPRTHEAWRRAIMAPRETPTVWASPIMHNPARKVRLPATGANTATTENWSGTAMTGGNLATVEAITALFVIPTPRVPFGTCDGTQYWSAYWPGLDGFSNNQVLQAGVDQEATCTNGQTSSLTNAWIEWYPNGAAWVSSPIINPGDLVFVEVWNTNPTQGYATFYNYSTDTAAEYAIAAPSGTALQGVSAEWIVERPGIPSLPLVNYIAMPWAEGVAWNYAAANPTTYSLGINPTSGTLQQIMMLDNSGNPISAATIENGSFLWFENQGSSCGVNQQPC
jgi:hypothetical protein